MKVGNDAAKALIEIVSRKLELPSTEVSRAQALDLPHGGGALLIVWGQETVPPAVGPDTSPVPGFSCPTCGSAAAVGAEDGDGDLTCLACGHQWHDDRLDDSKQEP